MLLSCLFRVQPSIPSLVSFPGNPDPSQKVISDVSVSAYLCMCAYVCAQALMHICIGVQTHVYMCVCMSIDVHMYAQA